MKELNIIKKSIKDYFTSDILKILIYPLLGSLVVLYVSFFILADFTLDSLEQSTIQIQQHQTTIENGVVNTEQTHETYTGSGIVDFLLKHTITSWIVGFLVYTIGFFAIGYLSIFISVFIVGLLTPKILSIIQKRHYSDIPLEGFGNISNSLWKLLKSIIVMIVLFLLLIPLYFIPLINIIAINLPFFYFFHKMLHFDVGSTILNQEKFSFIYYTNRYPMRYRSLLLYVVSLVPFAAFFISVFYIVYLGHGYFDAIKNNSINERNSLIRNN